MRQLQAVIAAYLRLALRAADFQRAAWLSRTLKTTVTQWAFHLNWQEDEDTLWLSIAELLQRLIHRRLYEGDWIHVPIPTCRSQREFVQKSIASYLAGRPSGRYPNAATPIVQASPRTHWLQENRKVLERAADKLSCATRANDLVSPSSPEAENLGAYTASILNVICVPEEDRRCCLPVAKGVGVRINDRVAPHLFDGNLDESTARKLWRQRILLAVAATKSPLTRRNGGLIGQTAIEAA